MQDAEIPWPLTGPNDWCRHHATTRGWEEGADDDVIPPESRRVQRVLERQRVFQEGVEESALDDLQVQLAGCLGAAEGATDERHTAKQGEYGWSPAYQAVLDLRLEHDRLKARCREAWEVIMNQKEALRLVKPDPQHVTFFENVEAKSDRWLEGENDE